VVDGLEEWSLAELAVATLAVCGAVVLLRLAVVSLFASSRTRLAGIQLPLRQATVISWAGMRGAVSLAAALAIPLETDAGAPFPDRALIIFLAFTVIMATLVLQGLSLPVVIRKLGVEDDGADLREEAKARKRAAQAALDRLEELAGQDWVYDDTAERMRGTYAFRLRRFGERFDESADGSNELRSVSYQRLRRELLDAERDAVIELRRSGAIADEVMHRVLRDIALEDARLDFER